MPPDPARLPRRVLVTGGAGFIGSALCRHLVAAGDAVLNLDKLTYAADLRTLDSIAANPRYAFRQIDICDGDSVGAAFRSFRPEVVFHLAAESHVDRSINGPAVFIETNVVGTQVLLEVARSYWHALPSNDADRFRFVQISTDEVYGSLGADGHFTEATRYDPSSPYAASKAAGDQLAIAWHRTYGLPVILANSSNNYGPFQFPEKLIPLTIINAIEGRPIGIYGDGSNVRDWLHVEDHARALDVIGARGAPGRKYNVGSRNERSNLALATEICALLDELADAGRPHAELIAFVEDRPGHDRRYAIDPSRLEAELGWRPERSFADGLRRTVAWYLENRPWWEATRAAYGGERLGLIEPIAARRGG